MSHSISQNIFRFISTTCRDLAGSRANPTVYLGRRRFHSPLSRTDAQIEASRVNGAKSQGPITPEGKQRSSQNAVKHGLSARTVVLCNEDHALFEQLEQDYIDSLQPCTVLELHLVQHIAVAEWRVRRAWSIETGINDISIVQHKLQDDREHPRLDDDYRLALTQKRVESDVAPVQRATARLERARSRAMAEFHRLVKIRPAGAQPIQITRPDVSTTGRDPAQYLQPRNEPKPEPASAPPTPPEPEPCIVFPDLSQARRRRIRYTAFSAKTKMSKRT